MPIVRYPLIEPVRYNTGQTVEVAVDFQQPEFVEDTSFSNQATSDSYILNHIYFTDIDKLTPIIPRSIGSIKISKRSNDKLKKKFRQQRDSFYRINMNPDTEFIKPNESALDNMVSYNQKIPRDTRDLDIIRRFYYKLNYETKYSFSVKLPYSDDYLWYVDNQGKWFVGQIKEAYGETYRYEFTYSIYLNWIIDNKPIQILRTRTNDIREYDDYNYSIGKFDEFDSISYEKFYNEKVAKTDKQSINIKYPLKVQDGDLVLRNEQLDFKSEYIFYENGSPIYRLLSTNTATYNNANKSIYNFNGDWSDISIGLAGTSKTFDRPITEWRWIVFNKSFSEVTDLLDNIFSPESDSETTISAIGLIFGRGFQKLKDTYNKNINSHTLKSQYRKYPEENNQWVQYGDYNGNMLYLLKYQGNLQYIMALPTVGLPIEGDGFFKINENQKVIESGKTEFSKRGIRNIVEFSNGTDQFRYDLSRTDIYIFQRKLPGDNNVDKYTTIRLVDSINRANLKEFNFVYKDQWNFEDLRVLNTQNDQLVRQQHLETSSSILNNIFQIATGGVISYKGSKIDQTADGAFQKYAAVTYGAKSILSGLGGLIYSSVAASQKYEQLATEYENQKRDLYKNLVTETDIQFSSYTKTGIVSPFKVSFLARSSNANSLRYNQAANYLLPISKKETIQNIGSLDNKFIQGSHIYGYRGYFKEIFELMVSVGFVVANEAFFTDLIA